MSLKHISLAREQTREGLADATQAVAWRRALAIALPFVRAGDQVDRLDRFGSVSRQAGLKLAGRFGWPAAESSAFGPLEQTTISGPCVGDRRLPDHAPWSAH